jgi:hypothetical protein
MRSNGGRKRLFLNEADINTSIVLEDEQDEQDKSESSCS